MSAATPQLYTPDDVAALLVTDFAARGINAVVEVGEWSPEKNRGAPRVVIGYGHGRVGEPAGHTEPGAWLQVAGGTDVARALLDDAQRLTLLVHAPAVGSGESAAAGARRATDQLLRQTFRAIRRAMAAPFREPADVDWPKKDDPRFTEYPGYVYGSVADVELVIASPVLDDALATGTITSAASEGTVIIDGVESSPDTITETVP
jgi:hypothetical protein